MSSDLSKISKLFSTDPEELLTLKNRVLGDMLPPIGKADAIYCFAGTYDTQHEDLKIGAMLWHRGYADIVAVLRGSTKHGYCGFGFCKHCLINYGVTEMAIMPIDLMSQDGDQLNTYTESKALILHAAMEKWQTIIVCAPFFHQIRASSTLISFLDQQDPALWIFNQSGQPGNVIKRVKHSQGIVEGDLFELFILELGRLFRYHDQGHIRSCAELIAYYDHRDKMFASINV